MISGCKYFGFGHLEIQSRLAYKIWAGAIYRVSADSDRLTAHSGNILPHKALYSVAKMANKKHCNKLTGNLLVLEYLHHLSMAFLKFHVDLRV